MKHYVVMVGRLGRDPEAKYTPAGKFVCNFNMAVNDGYGDNKGTIWVRVTTWGATGEACSKYLTKGALVLVDGRLNYNKETGGPNCWKQEDGTPRANFEVTAREVTFLETMPVEGVAEETEDYF